MKRVDCFLRICGIVLGCVGIIYGIVEIFGGFTKLNQSVQFIALPFLRSKWFCATALIVFPVYLYGIFKKKPWFMLPALILYLVFITLITPMMGFLILIGLAFSTSNEGEVHAEGIIVLFAMIIIMAILWFLIIASFTLFIRIKNSTNDSQGIVYQVGSQSDPNQNGVQITGI